MPNNNLVRSKYHDKLKEFKKKCKSKRNLYLKNKLNDIEGSLGDPKMFWEKWKNAKEIDNNPSDTKIKGKEWFDHFYNLHTETQIESLENTHSFAPDKEQSELGRPFSRSKFDKIIKALKNNKAEGNDGISNEMIANSPLIVLDLIFDFINLSLDKSLLPMEWCKDIINPIYKDGDMHDANNYRGTLDMLIVGGG